MKKHHILLLMAILTLIACRQDDLIIYPDLQNTGDQSKTDYLGLYILNEGNMGTNKATLDYLDLTTGTYSRNIYPSRNPNMVKELGDVGNDIKIYGNSLWMVINQSNKVEVADAQTAVSRGHVDVPNCRYLAFDGGYAYVSSYVGKIFEKSVLGSVYKVDTATLKIVDRCVVGYQPEEMAILNGKLYVANSGGYNPMQNMPYDKTVSVIDISTFKVTKSIDVAPNLFRLKSDKYGRLWVSSRGDYANIKSKLYLIENDVLADSVDVPIGDFDFNGDSLVYYGSDTYGSTPQYGVIDIRINKVVNRNFLHPTAEAPVKIPYGLIVHPITGDVYLMDATNYVSSGKLFCFDRNGRYKWNTWTGDIPGHACFLLRKKK